MFVSGRGSSAIKGLCRWEDSARFHHYLSPPRLPLPYSTGRPRVTATQADGEPMSEQRLTLCTPLCSPLLHSLESALSECCCFLPPGIALCFKMLQYEGRRGGFAALLRIHGGKLAFTFYNGVK